MSKVQKLAGQTAIYGVSSILGRAISFFLLPFLTSEKILNVAEYGIVTELYAYVAFFNVLYTYGMETAFFRYISTTDKEQKKVYNTTFTSVFITSIALSGILCLFATPIVNWLEFPGKEYFIYWFAAILGIDAIVAIPFALLRFRAQSKKFAGIKLFNIILNFILILFFLYLCKGIYTGRFLPWLAPFINWIYNPAYNVEYVFIANLIANATLLLLLYKELSEVKLWISSSMYKPMLKYAIPLLFSGLAGVTNEMLSRGMLKKLLPEGFYDYASSQEAIGIFGAVYKLSIFMSLAIQAYRYAAEPFFFSDKKALDSKETLAKVFYYFSIFGLLAFLGISLNLDIIKLIFLRNETYWHGLHVVPVLLLAYLFFGAYFNFSMWFKLTDKTIYATIISLVAAVVTIVGNLLFIPIYGYEGCAVITLVVYIGMSTAAYLLGLKYYPIPYNMKGIFAYLILALGLYYISTAVSFGNHYIDLLFKEILLAFFLMVVFTLERKKVKGLLRQRGKGN